MTAISDVQVIREHADRILASGVLGRSRTIQRLFMYIVEKSANGAVPKEVEIAIDVFDKDASFDVGHDSIVRVYIHKLRNRIDQFYAGNAGTGEVRIEIPKGQYRLSVQSDPVDRQAGLSTATPATLPRRLLAVLAFSLVLNLAWLIPAPTGSTPGQAGLEQVRGHPIWAGILDDNLPVTLVLGDYYIFAELDQHSGVRRLVRDFDVNSSAELQTLLNEQPELSSRYMDVDLNYLPVASAHALRDVLPVIEDTRRTINVMMMSEFNIAELRNSHVIYIGYISAMDKLSEFVFASSGLAVAGTYDQLTDLDTGEVYYSEAGILPSDNTNYRDYGMFSTFPGPNGNQVIVIAGMRDEGLMHTAYAVTTPSHLQMISLPDNESAAFEALYEVIGVDRTNLDAMMIYSGDLDYQAIWGGQLPTL